MSVTAAMCMAVGKVSLDDWPMLTWSLGWTGVLLPSVAADQLDARLLITSLTFMLDWVPEPVCQTYSGKLLIQVHRRSPRRRLVR